MCDIKCEEHFMFSFCHFHSVLPRVRSAGSLALDSQSIIVILKRFSLD